MKRSINDVENTIYPKNKLQTQTYCYICDDVLYGEFDNFITTKSGIVCKDCLEMECTICGFLSVDNTLEMIVEDRCYWDTEYRCTKHRDYRAAGN